MKTTIEQATRGHGWIDMRWGNGALEAELDVRNWGLGFNVRWYPADSVGGRLPVVVATRIGPFSAGLYLGRG